MDEARWLDEREARVWRGIIGVQQRLSAVLERRLTRDGGLSGAEYTLLVPLSEAPDGLLRARDLGRMVGWERSRISHQVARMEKRGLVAREECSEDARGSMVRLSDAGRAAIVAAAPAHVAAVRQYFFDALTDAELDVIGPALERVLDRLPESDGG
ncbi:MarR family winged helix-turn-helix transcriptional regulator [Pseudonocardia cypriaca]|uniref:DNA-binding MarR family transcriptional regulator n=1 Tax=Pseudonocardia cypriaca TaxID=882449 RepID=A0A543FV85_9PSEU|nr:MarR family transcriptional regulator [Pseudonocardia cypriaca]TQM37755.1 DNA-binding MarR family transcriptional regulator [Pseudonocardia cypriaca]